MLLPLRRGFDLGPRKHRLLSFAGNVMRLADDIRKSVVFIGSFDGEKFKSFGTAFMLAYKRVGYLVTARHVVEEIGDDPLYLRMNTLEGPTLILTNDPVMDSSAARWFASHDPAVDLAIMPFHLDVEEKKLDAMYLEAANWAFSEEACEEVHCGEFCYAVGLFRLMEGSRRNLPIVHTGHIAMLPSADEKIPVQSPGAPGGIVEVEGYLVEVTNLDGLSGSPVFVRHEVVVPGTVAEGRGHIQVARALVYLLGIWQSSWIGEPAPALNKRQGERVPVGMGVVIPAQRLLELFEREDVVAARNTQISNIAAEQAAKLDEAR